MLIIPFMSCSARLPVYVLLISAFFPKNQGLVLLSVYLFGILIAILSSILFKRVFFRRDEAPFVMELPPYRIPTTRSVVRHMWSKGVQYLRKMGTIILVASVIVWALSHYPTGDGSLTPAQQQEQSYIGRIGKAIEPAIRPLGFDWQIGVSLVSGLAAKEIVVSTMAVLTDAGDNEITLTEKLQEQVYTQGDRGKGLHPVGSLLDDDLYPALFPLYCSYYGYPQRGRTVMGRLYAFLHDGFGMAYVVYRVSGRRFVLTRKSNSHAGSYRIYYRRSLRHLGCHHDLQAI